MWDREVDVTSELLKRIDCLGKESTQRYNAFKYRQAEELEAMEKDCACFLNKINWNDEAINNRIKGLENKLASSKDISMTFNSLYGRFPGIVDSVRSFFVEIEGIKRVYAAIPPEIESLQIEAGRLKQKYIALDEKKIKDKYDSLIAKIENCIATLHGSVDSISKSFRAELLSLETELAAYNGILTTDMAQQKEQIEVNIKKLAALELQQIKMTTNHKLISGLDTLMKQTELAIANNKKLNDLHSLANINTCKSFHQALTQATQLAAATKANAALIIFKTTTEAGSNIVRTIGGYYVIQFYSLITNAPADPKLSTLSPGAFRDVFMESMQLQNIVPPAGTTFLHGYLNMARAIADNHAKKIWLGIKDHVNRYGNTINFPEYATAEARGAACNEFLKTAYKDTGGNKYIELAR